MKRYRKSVSPRRKSSRKDFCDHSDQDGEGIQYSAFAQPLSWELIGVSVMDKYGFAQFRCTVGCSQIK